MSSIDILVDLNNTASDVDAIMNGISEKINNFRNLSTDEINILIQNHNICMNWEYIYIIKDMIGLDRIHNCQFNGKIIICNFDKQICCGNNMCLSSGLYNSNFSGIVYLNKNCLIRNTTMISNIYIGIETCILDCGMVFNENYISTYGNGIQVNIGPENCGGRSIPMFVNLTYGELCKAVLDRSNILYIKELNKICQNNLNIFKTNISVINDYVIINRCDLIKNIHIGSYCYISSSILINSTLMSSKTYKINISINSSLTNCILQGCNTVTGPCQIMNTLIYDNANVSSNANISHCVLGPDRCVYMFINIYI